MRKKPPKMRLNFIFPAAPGQMAAQEASGALLGGFRTAPGPPEWIPFWNKINLKLLPVGSEEVRKWVPPLIDTVIFLNEN